MSKSLPQIKKHRLNQLGDSLQELFDAIDNNNSEERIQHIIRHIKYRRQKLNEVRNLRY